MLRLLVDNGGHAARRPADLATLAGHKLHVVDRHTHWNVLHSILDGRRGWGDGGGRALQVDSTHAFGSVCRLLNHCSARQQQFMPVFPVVSAGDSVPPTAPATAPATAPPWPGLRVYPRVGQASFVWEAFPLRAVHREPN